MVIVRSRVRRRGVIPIITTATSSASTTSSSTSSTTTSSSPTSPKVTQLWTRSATTFPHRVYDPDHHRGKDNPEEDSGATIYRFPAAGGQIGPLPLAFPGQGEAVLDATAALEDIRIVGPVIALADDVGRGEFQLGRELGGTGPLDVLGIVAGTFILAAHHIDVVFGAEGRMGGALELWDGGDAAVGRLPAATEGEGFDL